MKVFLICLVLLTTVICDIKIKNLHAAFVLDSEELDCNTSFGLLQSVLQKWRDLLNKSPREQKADRDVLVSVRDKISQVVPIIKSLNKEFQKENQIASQEKQTMDNNDVKRAKINQELTKNVVDLGQSERIQSSLMQVGELQFNIISMIQTFKRFDDSPFVNRINQIQTLIKSLDKQVDGTDLQKVKSKLRTCDLIIAKLTVLIKEMNNIIDNSAELTLKLDDKIEEINERAQQCLQISEDDSESISSESVEEEEPVEQQEPEESEPSEPVEEAENTQVLSNTADQNELASEQSDLDVAEALDSQVEQSEEVVEEQTTKYVEEQAVEQLKAVPSELDEESGEETQEASSPLAEEAASVEEVASVEEAEVEEVEEAEEVEGFEEVEKVEEVSSVEQGEAVEESAEEIEVPAAETTENLGEESQEVVSIESVDGEQVEESPEEVDETAQVEQVTPVEEAETVEQEVEKKEVVEEVAFVEESVKISLDGVPSESEKLESEDQQSFLNMNGRVRLFRSLHQAKIFGLQDESKNTDKEQQKLYLEVENKEEVQVKQIPVNENQFVLAAQSVVGFMSRSLKNLFKSNV